MPISSFIIGSSWGEKPARSRLAIIAITDGIKYGGSAPPWNHSCNELMVDGGKGAIQRASAGVAKGSISPRKENAMTLRSERCDVTNRNWTGSIKRARL